MTMAHLMARCGLLYMVYHCRARLRLTHVFHPVGATSVTVAIHVVHGQIPAIAVIRYAILFFRTVLSVSITVKTLCICCHCTEKHHCRYDTCYHLFHNCQFLIVQHSNSPTTNFIGSPLSFLTAAKIECLRHPANAFSLIVRCEIPICTGEFPRWASLTYLYI